MVILRFTQPWVNHVSPIVIRFGDTPVEPPIPVDNTIGIACGLIWIPPIEPLFELVLAESATDFEIQQSTDWSVIFSDGRLISSDWQSWYSHTIIAAMGWFISGETRSDLSLNWTTPADHIAVTGITWLTPDEHQQTQALNWLALDAEMLNTSVNWWDGAKHQTNVTLQYNGDVRDNQCAVKWGIPAARWVCSSKYRPPKSPIKIRFSDPFSANATPITIRFTASPEVCEWYPGGGLLNPFPDLPDLDFNIPIEPQIRRTRIMTPQLSCIRISDGLAIVLQSVSISQSRSQWASTGSVVFSSRLDAERATNELLKISINGYDFYLWCEVPSESKSFGVASYSASGRGRLAELSSPYIKATNYVNTTARTFMGLIGDVLANTGWTLASEITDFNVPAYAFSYSSKTPAEALSMMAKAIGAMLDINCETKTVTVIPQWPTVPWAVDNAIPDLIVHDGVIIEFNERREIRPYANAVFVRGEQQGVAVKVKRTGTAGDNFADDVVEKLITDVQAARMRGTMELANAGNKVTTTISTKLMADLPPMRPGMLVGVRKGIEVFKSVCDSASISASVNATKGVVTVNQSATLLRNEVAA